MGQNLIEVEHLSRQFGNHKALDDVSLSVLRGIVFGLVGENGAGKTTLIKHVLGLLKAQSGSVRVFDLDPVREPVTVLGRIGYLSEDRDLPDWMRVGEAMRYTSAFFPTWDWDFAQELVGTFALDVGQRIKTLSRGQRALAGLLMALAHRPELLVLDEPSSGLDPIARRDILSAIIRTVTDEGRTVLFSSHLLDEVERVSDRVAMIDDGRVVLCDDVDRIVSAHKRITLTFESPQNVKPPLQGTIACTGSGREWTCICNGEIERLRTSAQALGATIVEEEAASLDEVFIARVKKG